MDIEGIDVQWLGHAGFMLKGKGKIVCIDPFQIHNVREKADILLITHEHYDHCSEEDIAKVMKPETTVVTVKDCVEKINQMPCKEIHVVSPGDRIKIDNILIQTIPAYNLEKTFHPRSKNWVGFVVDIGKKVYHSGDSDFIPEMKDLKPDIALLPVSGTYVMSAKEAVEAACAIRPKVAVPMHYGSIVGSKADAHLFKDQLAERGINVEVF